ncbi:OrfY [Sinorhizobium sojae CCBAU 05684]|uniref:OrfY n=1 Tax=Sinorhizobium sojae CCBAU 05684 TaxID=716928 RepID=A0A249P8X5_9HYPH|nr:OrfY [Sinorhizobium sojae CCBAU 05684]
MKKNEFSEEREKIVAEAIRPVATELRLIDAADLIALLRFESYASLADLVESAAELYFQPGTVNFGLGGNYSLDWNRCPEITLDLELKPRGVTVYVRLVLAGETAGIEISHINFQKPSKDPDENTVFLARSLEDAKFVRSYPLPLAS